MISAGIFPVYNYCSERCKSAHQNSIKRDKKVKDSNKRQAELEKVTDKKVKDAIKQQEVFTKNEELKQKIESEKLQVELEKVKLENRRIRIEALNQSFENKPKTFWFYARLSLIYLQSL